jgi:formate dehydrogenase subunit gamma
MSERQGGTVGRYTTGARINHWITAMSLILLALSGMALFHPSLFFLTNLFGGGQMTRTIHPYIGVLLLVSFAGLFLRFVRYNLWNRDDSQWMKQLGDVVNAREEKLPELGRYNAGQKIVFWAMTIMILVLFASGVILWDVYFADVTSIDQKRLAALLHAGGAIVAIVVWIVHV